MLGSCSEKESAVNDSDHNLSKSFETSFKILILGDSLTEGYGVNEEQAYPFLLEKKLNTETTARTGKNYKIINGGISGSTTSGGVARIEWFLRSEPDLLILALGGNDGLRGIPTSEIRKNLSLIIKAAQTKKIQVLLAGMKIPPNYGLEYTVKFSSLFQEISEEFEIPMIPFLLEGVGGVAEMNLPDRIHPNFKGHQVMCETVYKNLIKILE